MSEVDIDKLMMPPPPTTTRKRPRTPPQEQLSVKVQDACEVSSDDSAITVGTPDKDNERDDPIFEKKELTKVQAASIGSENVSNTQPTHLNTKPGARVAKSSNVRFSDIIGHSAAKLRLDEALLPLALPPSLARSVLTGVRAAPASILLHGPPGCGKTQLARAVAGEAQAAFLTIGPSDILSKFVGESEAAVREVFQEARNKALETESNCTVLFFDEIDALGQSRGSSGSDGNGGSCSEGDSNSGRRVLAEILIQMTNLMNEAKAYMEYSSDEEDIFPCNNIQAPFSTRLNSMSPVAPSGAARTVSPDSDIESSSTAPSPTKCRRNARVIVVAATNRPEDCDPALLRRFAVRVLVGLPSRRDRKRIVRRLLTNIDHSISSSQLDELAAATDGWSGSDLESLSREAVMAPIRECLREAAVLKLKSRKRQQKGGAESCQEEESQASEDNDDSARDALLNGFRDLRPVTLSDFERAVSFWMGIDEQSSYGNSTSAFRTDNQMHLCEHYDSESSSEEND